MNFIDSSIIILYLIGIVAIGAISGRKKDTSQNYFLAGRHMGWFVIGASLFASNISSEHFVGLAGTGASSGLAVGHFEWLACIIVLVLGWVFVPFYIRSGVFTMPEFLERRFNRGCRNYLSSVSIAAYIFTKISVSLFAGSIILQQVAGWGLWTSCLILVLATGIYTIMGGLRAVIITDTIQTVLLIIGAVTLTIISMVKVGGWQGLHAALPEDYFHMIKPATHPDFPWTGIFFGAPILGIWYWCTDQVIVQRTLAAKDIPTAQKATIFAGFLKILPVFILVLPGLAAKALFPEVDGDTAFPTLVDRLLPVGFKGLMIAALLAALMSSLSSVFNSSSTLVTMDFYKPWKPQASEKELVFVGQIATIGMVVLGILWIPFMKYISTQLYVYLQSVQAYISAPIASVFIFGILWPRANGKGALSALLTGLVVGGARFVLEIVSKQSEISSSAIHSFVHMNFLHFAVFLFAICSAVLVIVSLMTEKPSEANLRGYTFAYARKDGTTETPDRFNVLLSIALVLTVVFLWVLYR
ncbi:MAG: sodium:solute symporter [Bdellovibrionales bacterium]|nr:sodium:solute symporter [Bdellovibrionales bacterium]